MIKNSVVHQDHVEFVLVIQDKKLKPDQIMQIVFNVIPVTLNNKWANDGRYGYYGSGLLLVLHPHHLSFLSHFMKTSFNIVWKIYVTNKTQ